MLSVCCFFTSSWGCIVAKIDGSTFSNHTVTSSQGAEPHESYSNQEHPKGWRSAAVLRFGKIVVYKTSSPIAKLCRLDECGTRGLCIFKGLNVGTQLRHCKWARRQRNHHLHLRARLTGTLPCCAAAPCRIAIGQL